MMKINNIVEYKRAGDPEWRFVSGGGDYEEALRRFEDAKKTIPDAAEVRIRVKVSQSQIAEEWKRGEKTNENTMC